MECLDAVLILFVNGSKDIMTQWRQSLSVTTFTFLSSSEHVGKCDVQSFPSQS